MLEIETRGGELWDEKANEFVNAEPASLLLEHSLLSASKWEAKYKRPFLGKNPLSQEELVDYVKMMTLNYVEPSVYYFLTTRDYEKILRYIEDPMTATTFREQETRKFNQQIITTELIYYWMTAMNIPFECEKWHLNRLLVLIRVCSIKSSPPKKRSKAEILREQHELNEKRKREYHTRG